MTYPPDAPSSAYRDDQTSSYPDPLTAPPPPPGFGSEVLDTSTTDVAKEQASEIGQSATQAGQHVAQTAKEQAAQVAGTAKIEAKNLADRTRTELTYQAQAQQQRAAEGLRSLGTELTSMADNSDQDGPATQVARQAADRISDAAAWLEVREPGQILTEVQRFARQRPGAFLAIAVTAGVVAGRLTRGLAADSSSSQSQFGAGQPGDRTSYAGAQPYAGLEPVQPNNGWQTTDTPDSYAVSGGAAAGVPEGYIAPIQPPPTGEWGQDVPPADGGGYPTPGAAFPEPGSGSGSPGRTAGYDR